MKRYLLFAVMLFLAWCPLANAQRVAAIDGSKNPELISDRVALRLVLRSLAGEFDRGDNLTVAQRIAILNLSEKDSLTMAGIVAAYAKAQRDTDTTNGAQFTLITDIKGEKLIEELSIDGREIVRKFLQTERWRMRTDPEEDLTSDHRYTALTSVAFHPGHPQGTPQMSPHYSSYIPTMPAGNEELDTSGYANCTNPPGSSICSRTMHQERSTLEVGTCPTVTNCSWSTGGTTYGPQVAAQSYSQVSASVTIPWDQFWNGGPTVHLYGIEQGATACQFLGPNWWIGFFNDAVSFEFAFTYAQVTNSPPCYYVAGGGVICYVSYDCPTDSSPPDFQPRQVFTNSSGIANFPPHWLMGTECFSIAGSPYVCLATLGVQALSGSGLWKTLTAPAIPWNVQFECTNAAKGTGPSIPWPW